MDFQKSDDPVLNVINTNTIQVLLWLTVKLSHKVYLTVQHEDILRKTKNLRFEDITTKQHPN